ncbi:MAG: hypothetical protein KAS38_19875 [Anaerolineales bacterium]|nr:hypothetical protein [Anaerolineales bacterium]
MPSDAQYSLRQRIQNHLNGLPLTGRLSPLWTLLSGQSARGGYLAAVDQGIISLSNFLATIMLARNVSPTELGVYGVGFIALRLVRAFQEGLVVQPLNVFGAGMKTSAFRRYATSVSLIQVILALATAAVAAMGGWVLTAIGNDTAGPALFALWSAFLWWQLHEYIRRMLYTRGAVLQAVIITSVSNIVRVGLMAWWISEGTLTGIGGLYAIAWGSLVGILPGLWFTRAYWTKHPFNIINTWRHNWDFGRWITGGIIANWVSVEFYPILTAGMVSFAAVGAYRALQNIVAPIHLLLRALDTYLTPRAAMSFRKKGYPELNRTLRLAYLVTFIPVIGLLALGILFREQLLYLLYGKTYLVYSQGILLMALYYALWYAYWPLQSAFKAARLSRPIFLANMAAIATMFTIGILAIRAWDVYGTIAGQALNALVINLVLWSTWRTVRRNT